MYHLISFRQSSWSAFVFKLRWVTLKLLPTGLGLLLMMPFAASGQYPALPFPEKYQGPSGEPGQIILDGVVTKVELFHGTIDDELDWHDYIRLHSSVRQDLHSHVWNKSYRFMSSEDCLNDQNCELGDIYSEVMVIDERRDDPSLCACRCFLCLQTLHLSKSASPGGNFFSHCLMNCSARVPAVTLPARNS